MQRRTLLQGLLSLPFIGFAAKAFSTEKSYPGTTTGRFSAGGPNVENIPKKRDISHVLFFNRENIKENGWEDMVPIMVLRNKQKIPLQVLLHCTAAVDMTTMRCVKNRDGGLAAMTDAQHEEFALMALTRAYFNMGDGPHELTDEIRVKNGLAFPNLREARTGEML